MLEYTKINLIVDSQDLSCPICYSPFGITEKLPISVNCGHTFCSVCVREMDKCAICKNHFRKRQKFHKSILISSFLESDSKAKKCTVHEKPIEGFCLEMKKLVCFDCLADKQQIISIKEMDRKVDQLSKIIQETREYHQTEMKKFLEIEQENLKRRVDDVLHEETCYAPLLRERLYKEIENLMEFEKNYFQNDKAKESGVERLQSTEIMLEKWRRNSQEEDAVALQILETKIDLKIGLENLDKPIGELKRGTTEKQNQLLGEINNNRAVIKCLSKKLKQAFEESPGIALKGICNDLEAQYLNEITEEYFKIKFNPIFFDCRMTEVDMNFQCFNLSNQYLPIISQTLESLFSLRHLTLVFDKISESEFDSLSNLLLKVKNLEGFIIMIEKDNTPKPLLAKLGDHLRSLGCFSRFDIKLKEGVIPLKLISRLIN